MKKDRGGGNENWGETFKKTEKGKTWKEKEKTYGGGIVLIPCKSQNVLVLSR